MSPRKHSSSIRLLVVGLTSLLMFATSCGSADSIGALGEGGSGGSGGGTGTPSGGANGTGGSVGQGGLIASGGMAATGGIAASGGATTGAGGSGSGGQVTPDAGDVKTDSSVYTDASALLQLCTSTGGQPKTQDCCGTVGDFPDMCGVGACGCSPSGSHPVTVCVCLNMGCFSPTAGCNLGVGGSGGSTGSRTDATTLADLCQSTGGHLASQQACLAVSEFPNTCLEAACSPANSHTVTGCACPTDNCFSPTSGCGPLSTGTGGNGSGGAVGSGGASGNGGVGGNIVVKLDAPISTDATALADLCKATGGTIESKSCCANATDFPDSCMAGACGCAPEYSHDIPVCTCPTGTCFSYSLGCALRDAGSTADTSQCTAQPGLDTYCGGSKPPHYYACVMSVPSECSIVSIGDMTNGVCCP